jgi:tRNA nucleotidyltransferase (CCA-adding enzyme)
MGRAPSRLLERLIGRLPEATLRALRGAISIAGRQRAGLYLVGGGVRDLLLRAPQLDVDIVVEGDALALAQALGEDLGGRVVTHPRFGTASVAGEGFRLDFAQARGESYVRPGALPIVRPATLDEDLARRDFTINAMALRLSGPQAGALVDPCGGRRDLRERLLRVLHDDSFQDDATRILRALRYAGRLQFRLEPHTEALLRRDLCFLDTIGGARVRHELERIAAEERVGAIVRLAARLDVLEAVHPAIGPSERALRAIARLPRLLQAHRDAALFCLLLADAPAAAAEQAIGRLALTGRQATAVAGLLALRREERKLGRAALRPSEAAAILSPRPVESIEAFALLAGGRAAQRGRRYLDRWQRVRPRLNGRDVQALGVPRGPQVGVALEALRAARLDGRTRSRDEEATLVRRSRSAIRRRAEARRGR